MTKRIKMAPVKVSVKTHAVISKAAELTETTIKEQLEQMSELLPLYLEDLYGLSKKEIQSIYSAGRAPMTKTPKGKRRVEVGIAFTSEQSQPYGKAAALLGIGKAELISEVAAHSFILSARQAGFTIDQADKLYTKTKVGKKTRGKKGRYN